MKHRLTLAFFVALVTGSTLFASGGPSVDIPARIKGANKVVVATVTSVTPGWSRNEFGDQLIVSEVELQVGENLKGNSADLLWLDVEGGTIGNVTLHVSTLPTLLKGDRGVFFLDETTLGTHLPHLRGQGILKLDSSDHVQDSNLTLGDIRRMARDASK
jgi:hypothetical protein